MPLLAYNKTIAPLALAAGAPIVTLPASSSAGARGVAVNVTGELRGLSNANYALLQVQVAAGSVDYEWTTLPEYSTATLVVGSAAAEIGENPIAIYVNGATGDDNNPGTLTSPVATLIKALDMVPLTWKKSCRIILDVDGVGRTYVSPTNNAESINNSTGILGTPLIIIGTTSVLVASQAEAVGGSNQTLNGVGFGAANSLQGYWVRITSGVNIGQRRQIKVNTATTVTTNTNFPSVFAIGDTYVIENAATQINLQSWRPLFGEIVFKNVKMNMPATSGSFFNANNGILSMSGVEVQLNALSFFFATLNSFLLTNPSGSFTEEGASSPCPAAEDFAGVLFRGPGNVQWRAGEVTNNCVFTLISASTIIQQHCQIVGGSTWTVEGGSFLVDQESEVNIGPSPFTTNRNYWNAVQVIVDRMSFMNFFPCEMNNSPASAILARRNSLVTVTNTIGTGNVRYGVECTDDSSVRMVDTLSTVTGLLGDLKCGTRPVRTWADFFAASPASNLPSKNEFDSGAFVAKPFKISFAGLVAADSFDITTLGAFATPAGATSVLSSIWQTTIPAIQNASTLRVTAGAAAFVGSYMLTDTGGTTVSPAASTVLGVATLSDDGKTITFPAGTMATDFVIEYTPVSGTSTGARIYQN